MVRNVANRPPVPLMRVWLDEVSDELQSLRDSHPCPGVAIRATQPVA
jgi:hypothetical protein